MMLMKKLMTSALLATAVALPAMALAAEMTDGEVRKVSKDTGKITLKHGEIKNLDMPPMTMVFQVKDPGLLDKVKPGDKVDRLSIRLTLRQVDHPAETAIGGIEISVLLVFS